MHFCAIESASSSTLFTFQGVSLESLEDFSDSCNTTGTMSNSFHSREQRAGQRSDNSIGIATPMNFSKCPPPYAFNSEITKSTIDEGVGRDPSGGKCRSRKSRRYVVSRIAIAILDTESLEKVTVIPPYMVYEWVSLLVSKSYDTLPMEVSSYIWWRSRPCIYFSVLAQALLLKDRTPALKAMSIRCHNWDF